MITLTIDGREVSVEAGTTILDAARRLGIEIPTLCHVEGLEPSASCFLCCVQVEGARTLSPACAMPAADGNGMTGLSSNPTSGGIEPRKRQPTPTPLWYPSYA